MGALSSNHSFMMALSRLVVLVLAWSATAGATDMTAGSCYTIGPVLDGQSEDSSGFTSLEDCLAEEGSNAERSLPTIHGSETSTTERPQ